MAVKYVMGLIFDEALANVLLVKKLSPPSQRGHWNGSGGKIQSGETPLDAIRREAAEELLLNKARLTAWQEVCVVDGQDGDGQVVIFVAVYADDPKSVQLNPRARCEIEYVAWFHVDQLPRAAIDDIPALVSRSLNKLREKQLQHAHKT